MANTKVTQHVIANNAITADQLASAAVTDAKLHSTLDLSGKTLTLPATAIPSASTATTQAASDNSTKLATTAYVTTAIGNLNDSAPTALNTLNELAAALGDDANFSATITTSLASKLPLAGGTMTGDIVLSGAPSSGLHPATKTYTDTADALKLNLSGGTLTGDLILNTTTALQIPAGTTGQRPSAATGQIRWNTTDGAIEVYNGTAWTAVGTGSSNKVLDTFTGDNSTTTFTLSITPANEDAIMVFIDGAYQEKGDYVLTNNSLALGTAPLSGEKIAVHTTTASVHDGTTALNQAFTGDGSTTDFTLSQDPKSENNTQIYINGVYQQKTDYTVTGTTLAFDTAPDTGDIIEVNMFTVATLGNTDTVNEGVSNLYHTTARARGAISVSGNAILYNNLTGVLTSNFEESPSFTGTVSVAGNISSGGVFKLSSHRSTYVDASEDSTANSHMFVTNDGVGDFSQEAGHLVIQARTHTSVYRDIIFAGGINNASDLMRITGEGNTLIGGTNPAPVSNNVAGISLRAVNGEAQISVDGAAALYLNRKTNDGDIAVFRKDGAAVASIGAYNGVPYIGYQGGAGGGIMFNGAAIEPTALGSSRTSGANDIGSVTYRWRNIHLSGGVVFGATGGNVNSKTLDDYEEGSFTATLKGGSSGTITATDAEYTKIGNTVHCRVAFINVNTTGYSGHLRVEGLPFPAGDSGLRNVCTPAMYRIGAFTADYVIGLLESSTHVNFYGVKSANTWNTVAHDAGASRYLEFNITYNTNA
jgi:hypothetical protein